MPRIQTGAVIWYSGAATRLPLRSSGLRMPLFAETKMHEWRKDRDERRLVGVEGLHVRGERHLRGVELLEARLAPERFLDLERQVDEVDAFHAHAAVGERARAVVGPAGEGDAQSLHGSLDKLPMTESSTRRAARTSAGDTPRTARRFTSSASGTSF